jgi:hypothetical protein
VDRRFFLAGSSLLLTAARGAPAATSPLRQAAQQLLLYALPLIEIAQVRQRALAGGQTANAFRHSRTLATAKARAVTQPNNDTLYSSAWLDLAQGPVKITLPKTGARYFSLSLMDTYTNNFAILGTRTLGGDGGDVTLIGPRAPMPAAGALRSPTDWVWALGRTLVDGPGDLAAAHAVQDGLTLSGPAGRTPVQAAARDAEWSKVLASIQALLLESPPPITDSRRLHEVAALGVRPAGGFDPGRFSPAQAQEITAGLADGLETARSTSETGQRRGDWSFPRQDLGNFGQDYTYRAQVALSGLAAMTLEEAAYLRAVTPDGHDHLDSRRAWRLRFPAGQTPPVDAFWSLTAYEVTPAGQGFLVDNPIDRYAIGDRTPGLTHNADGSLDIWISPSDPGPKRRANWLPAPSGGQPMVLSLRAYLPRPELITGAYRVPSLTPA